MVFGAESEDKECGTQTTLSAALVSSWTAVADRRTGCEGRISAPKRRHGMRRCLFRGFDGMQRWVGLSVIADNVIQIGRCLALQATGDLNGLPLGHA